MKPIDTLTRNREPAERDPGPGWLRSRFMGKPWPRPGVSACGRPGCPVCDPKSQSLPHDKRVKHDTGR